MRIVLALDAGTSGVRAVAFSPTLEPLDEAYRDLPVAYPHPGEVEQDPATIAALARDVLAEVARRRRGAGDEVVAVGITNQRETTVAFDRASGVPLAPALVWQDRRTAPACAALRAAGHESALRAATGLVLDPYFSATKMAWLAEHGAGDRALDPVYATVDTWLVWTLTGGPDGGAFVTEPSNASRTALFDLTTLDWSGTLAGLFGVDASRLASVRPSAGLFGEIDAVAVEELAGVPITGVLGDQQAALLGQACVAPGQVKATYGTGAFVLAHAGADVPVPAEGLLTTVAWDLGAHGPAHYAYEGSAFVAGAALTWLAEVGLVGSVEEVEPLARSVGDASGVRVVPALTGLGSPFWNPLARGTITGLSRGTGRAEIARALVEALAFQVRAMTDAFTGAGVSLTELRADGGAAVMDLLLELQADVSGLPVARSDSLEATARGAASVAALGAGLVDSLEEVAELWRPARRFAPRPDRLEPTGAAYAAWRREALRA
ncbi:MAG TPA: FGGY family carbohydrate kinase [Acidimicrobiales bacterium]|nr:FGGY family carbohydrate kinase [Acidimicrobiales bacterium]